MIRLCPPQWCLSLGSYEGPKSGRVVAGTYQNREGKPGDPDDSYKALMRGGRELDAKKKQRKGPLCLCFLEKRELSPLVSRKEKNTWKRHFGTLAGTPQDTSGRKEQGHQPMIIAI